MSLWFFFLLNLLIDFAAQFTLDTDGMKEKSRQTDYFSELCGGIVVVNDILTWTKKALHFCLNGFC